MGALLVGAYNADGELQFCGLVGAGLSSSQRRRLSGALEPLRSTTMPFTGLIADAAAHARWVRPELVGESNTANSERR
jgi:bifunctional non-homologous end joining protein LigD